VINDRKVIELDIGIKSFKRKNHIPSGTHNKQPSEMFGVIEGIEDGETRFLEQQPSDDEDMIIKNIKDYSDV
jgi:hypothetical protein